MPVPPSTARNFDIFAIVSADISRDPGPSVKWRAAGRTPRLGILMMASEAAPWAKTGGLADVLSGLPKALDQIGHRVTIVLPRYRGIDVARAEAVARRVTVGAVGYDVTLHVLALSRSLRVVFVDYPPFFDREGYTDRRTRIFPTTIGGLLWWPPPRSIGRTIRRPPRWTSFTRTTGRPGSRSRTCGRCRGGGRGSLAPAWYSPIHNLAYQGLFPREAVPALGLGWEAFGLDTAEFWNQLSFLKAGITYSDMLTTVSPTYAKETQTPAFGSGLDGVLRARADRYVGILNGIDTGVWDPSADVRLPATYAVGRMDGKRECKRGAARAVRPAGWRRCARAAARRTGLASGRAEGDRSHRRGDARASANSTPRGCSSDRAQPRFEAALRALAGEHPSRVGVSIGFDEGLAHLVEAGADIFLMPSRFEPCGLNQLYSLRYGAVPVVHAVGGLEDTIQPYTRARPSRQRIQVSGRDHGGARAGRPGRGAALRRSDGVGAARASRHERGSLLEHLGARICQSV